MRDIAAGCMPKCYRAQSPHFPAERADSRNKLSRSVPVRANETGWGCRAAAPPAEGYRAVTRSRPVARSRSKTMPSPSSSFRRATGGDETPIGGHAHSGAASPRYLPRAERGLKVRDVIRLIQEDGWFQVRQRGSHRQFKHATKAGLVTIAGKPGDELAAGTLASVLKQAGLDEIPRRC